jgi:glycosyltransferase involved in cell wall biosynthesis
MQERYFPGFFPIKEKILRYITKKMVTNYATHILCESNFVKNDIIKFLGITQDKISVIPGPPVLHFFHTKHDEKKLLDIKTKYNLPEYFIIYPAHFWPHKNHLRLLDAFAQVSKEYSYVHLLLTGSKQNYYNKVVTKIEDLGLKEKVHYLGYVCYDDLPALYKMSKMLVMPSLFESISIPVYEAFALKVPVCCSNVGALPEQVGNGGLTFDPNNPDDIAEKIGCVLRDEKLAKNLAGKGYNIVQNLTHKRYSERLVEVIERCTVI